jgi:hypothetical protein
VLRFGPFLKEETSMNVRVETKHHQQRPANAAARLAAAQAGRLRLLVRVATGGKGTMLDRLLQLIGLPRLRLKLNNGQTFFELQEKQGLLRPLA